MFVWIAVGILVLFVGFACYKALEVWNGAHVALAAGLFVMCLLFLFLAAGSLRARLAWMKKHDGLVQQLENEERKIAELSRLEAARFASNTGRTLVARQSDDPSIEEMTAELKSLVVQRGRVWRMVQPVPSEDGIALNMAQWGDDAFRRLGMSDDGGSGLPAPVDEEGSGDAGEAAAPASPVTPHGLEPQMIVYAFGEIPVAAENFQPIRDAIFDDPSFLVQDSKGVFRVPFGYLGEFRVTQVFPDGNLVVAPTSPPDDPRRLTVFPSWALYEAMPRDMRGSFEGMPLEKLSELFGLAMQFINVPKQGAPLLADEYFRDGRPAEANDPEPRRWVNVLFEQAHQFEVDVEGEVTLPDRNFDPSGRALEPSLWHAGEGPVEIAAQQEGIFDPVTAQQLIRSGAGKVQGQVFMRRLRDFGFELSSLRSQIHDFKDQQGVAERNVALLQQSKSRLDSQIEYRRQERDQLHDDLVGFQRDIDVLTAHRQQLEQRIAEMRSTLKSLYKQNLSLVGS